MASTPCDHAVATQARNSMWQECRFRARYPDGSASRPARCRKTAGLPITLKHPSLLYTCANQRSRTISHYGVGIQPDQICSINEPSQPFDSLILCQRRIKMLTQSNTPKYLWSVEALNAKELLCPTEAISDVQVGAPVMDEPEPSAAVCCF
jgi:hypothetical protein